MMRKSCQCLRLLPSLDGVHMHLHLALDLADAHLPSSLCQASTGAGS